MNDERDDREEEDRSEEGVPGEGERDGEEKDGLGLTDEFARLESEIEREAGGPVSKGEEDDGETGEWAVAPESSSADDADGEADPDPVEEPAGGAARPGEAADDEEAEGAHEAEEPEAEEPVAEEPEAAAVEEPAAPVAADASAVEHTIVRPRPLAPRPAAVAMGHGGLTDESSLDNKTPALWWRFLTGSVLIVVSTATAVSLFLLLFLTEVAADLQPIPGVTDVLDEINPGEPQTILIVGSDKRSETPGDPGRSDTTMLLRVDADKGVLSLFSLPRDLKVEIPNYGTGRLNEAFTVGGIKKTLETVQDLTGQDIDVVVNVDFQGFADAVDAIECVYVDVDHDYFHSNEGLFGEEEYSEIDVNAGYQRLCGLDALAYVRYRHEDNDIIRAARQQDFLREARQKVQPSELLFNGTGNDLIEIFTQYTSSNVDEASEVIGILKSFIAVRNVPIQQVSFEGNLADVDENGVAYVTATDEQIRTAVDQFLEGATTEGQRGGDEADAKRGDGGGKKKKDKKAKEEDPTAGSSVIEADASIARFGSTSARRLKFPVWVPTAVVPGSTYSPGSRQYEIKDLEEDKQPAYKLVISYQTPSTLTEYYGVEGTTWSDPPILKNKSESREIGDRTYDLYYDGDRLRIVAWHDIEGNSYWVSNTLAHTLEEEDMLAIATSMDEAHG